MLTEEETVLIIYQIQASCNIILMMMQALIICSRKRKIAIRSNLRQRRVDRILARRDHIARLVTDNDNDCFKQLRIRIAPFHRLVQRLGGFGLKDSRSVTVEEQANPKAKPLRHVGIRNYDKLCIIFGSDRANGNLSYEAHDEVPLSQLNLDSGTQGDTNDAHEYMNVDSDTPYEAAHNEYPSSGGAGAASGGGQSSGTKHDKARPQAGQKRRRSLPGYDKYDNTLLLMAEAANNMSTSVKELTSTLKKPALPRLLGILKGIPELSYGDITRAMIVFGRDLSAADILVSMEEGMRYEFVRSMLG